MDLLIGGRRGVKYRTFSFHCLTCELGACMDNASLLLITQMQVMALCSAPGQGPVEGEHLMRGGEEKRTSIYNLF
jgi:hypothetical protein